MKYVQWYDEDSNSYFSSITGNLKEENKTLKEEVRALTEEVTRLKAENLAAIRTVENARSLLAAAGKNLSLMAQSKCKKFFS